MARVFVSDCLEKIPNKNELVVLAAKHARTIPQSRKLVPGSLKNRAVSALREIEAGKITAEEIVENWVQSVLPPRKEKVAEPNPDTV